MPGMNEAPVFPVHIFERAGRWHKEPRINDWKWRATTNSAQIAEWRRQFGDAFGIPLVRVGWVVIDADRHGGPDGVEALAKLVADREWPKHPIVATAGGGFHHVFGQPNPALGNKTGGLPGGLDVRGVGGWIVQPGTVRDDGAVWRLVEDGAVPRLPGWIEEIIRAKRTISQRAIQARGISLHATQVTSSTGSSTGSSIASSTELPKALYFKLNAMVPLSETVTRHELRRVRGILLTALNWQTEANGEVFCQRDGAHRNDGLHWATHRLRELGFVDREVAVELLIDVTRLNGYLAKDGIEAVERTIESAWPDGDVTKVA
jgi:hypothetical protein